MDDANLVYQDVEIVGSLHPGLLAVTLSVRYGPDQDVRGAKREDIPDALPGVHVSCRTQGLWYHNFV